MDWPANVLKLLMIVATHLAQFSHAEDLVFKIKINTNISNPTYCHEDFLSMAAGLKKRTARSINPRNHKLRNLAAALGPTNLRLGGSTANFLTFDPNEGEPGPRTSLSKRADKTYNNYTMTGQQWEIITNFIKSAGWTVMFDLNALNWRQSNGSWDPTNAELLLDFSQRKGIDIDALELGNEPNSNCAHFGKCYSPETLVRDLRILRNTLNKFPKYRNTKIVGPVISGLTRPRNKYMDRFLEAGGNKAVDAISWHHYYLNGRTATPDQFLDPNVLDDLKKNLQHAKDLFSRYSPVRPMVLSETSSCFGGGAPNLSNRFIAGFLWLDKLGLCAQFGVARVNRQTLNSGPYGVVNFHTHDPYPDYYLSLLYKRLILGPVLSASFEPQTDLLRMYAHCARTDYYSYPKGAVVIYYLNLQNSTVTLTLPEYEGNTLDLYLLTPGDADGLRSKFVKLNGQTLTIRGSDLPPLTAKRQRGDVTVEPQSFGYIVVLNAMVSDCL